MVTPSSRTVAVIAALALVVTAPAGADEQEAPGSDMANVIPTPVSESSVTAVDIDGDGVDEILTLSRDGVAQLYDGGGNFRWSVSTVEVAHRLGSRPWTQVSSFEGDFRGFTGDFWFTQCRTTDHGFALLDVNGDGYRDVVATTWLSTVTPVEEQRSYLVVLDGRTGEILDLHRFEGWVTNVVAAGATEVFVTEEDGPVELPLQPDEGGRRRLERGTGGTTLIHRYDLSQGQSSWTYDTQRAWGQATAVVAGSFDGAGTDIAAVVTSGTDRPECSPDVNNGPDANEVMVIDGDGGGLQWSTAAPAFVRELVALPDGDGGDDVVLQHRGSGGSGIERFDGGDGTSLWTAALPAGDPVVWDVANYGEDVAAALAVPVPGTGRVAHAAVVDGETGALEMDTVVEHTTGSINRMRLATVALDGAADRAIVVRTDRNTTAVSGSGLPLWQRRSLEAAHVLVVTREADGEWLWVQGPVPDPQPSIEPPDEVLNTVEHGRYRLFGIDPDTGTSDRTIPLVGPVYGLTRVDIDGDGVLDRVMGGASEAVFAFDGGTQRLLWATFLGDPDLDVIIRGEEAGNVVLDIELTDVDGDGRPDLIVESHLEVFALSATDGRILWSFEHAPTLGAGRWNGFELTDLDGDGVRDVVLGISSSRSGGGHNLVESAHVVAVNGATGERLWQVVFPWHLKNVNGLDVGDVDGDGVDDVAVTLDLFWAPGLLYSVVVMDGTDGSTIWETHEDNGLDAGQHTVDMNAVRMIDADGDDLADVSVLRRGNERDDTLVLTHEGATGDLLWTRTVESDEHGPAIRGWGMFRGHLEPEGPPVLFVAASARSNEYLFVHAIAGDGKTVFNHDIASPAPAPQAWTWELEIGDVTGDGISDVVAPWMLGMVVVDGGKALSDPSPPLPGPEDRPVSKVKLFDLDGDGALEIEALRTPGSWPLYVNEWHVVDPTFRTKAVFTLDLTD